MTFPSYGDRRRRLARRLAALEPLERRSTVSESLFSLGTGIGAAAGLLVGPRLAGATSDALLALRPRAPRPDASPARGAAPAPGGARPGPTLAAPARASDAGGRWLTLSDPAAAPRTSVPPAPSGGGAGGTFGGGGGPVAGGAIRPVRFAPPPDLGGASSSLLAAAGLPPATGPGAAPAPAIGPVPAAIAADADPDAKPAEGGADPAGRDEPGAAYLGPGDVDPSGGGIEALAGGGTGLFTVPGLDLDVPKGAFDHFVLYTLDYNDGTVLFPGFAQVATAGAAVDLRAQVKGATVSTYAWDTTNLNGASGISGASTYNLRFTWLENAGAATTSSVTLTVTNDLKQAEVQTYTFIRPGPQGAASGGGASWAESLPPDLQLAAAPAFGSHHLAIDALSGSVNTALALPAYNPNIPALAFAYDSVAADPRPIILERHPIDDSKAVPSQVTAALTFNGTTGATSYYDTAQFTKGDIQQIPLQVGTAVSGTGRYAYTATMGDVRSGVTTTTTATGTATVIDESASAIGAGWTVAGLERIHSVTGGLILNLGLGGRSLWYAAVTGSGGGGTTYTTPPGDFSAVAPDGSGWTRTLTDGTVERYDSSGRQTSVADRNGLRVTYAYDGSGRLTSVTDPYGQATALAYVSGKLRTVTDPASRVATFTHTGSDLTAVTLPDSGGWGYTYDAAHRLTAVADPNSRRTTVAYDAAYRANTITRPDATTQVVRAYQVRGFVTGTSSGSPGAATLLAEARASHTDPRGYVTDLRPDWRGQGLVNQPTDPEGYVSTRDRDANGLATIAVDRLNRVTTHSFDSKGNATGVTYPDGNRATLTYNGFSQVTAASDPNLNLTTFTYDGEGNLTEARDALSNRTTFTYTANGRVATAKDANSKVTSYQYDSKDRLTTVTHPAIGGSSATTLYAYDAKGNVATVTNERGHSTTYGYDAMNRLTGVKDALGNRTTITYDSGGNPTQVQAPLSRTTNYAHDTMDRLATQTDPLSHATTLTYDSGGNLKTVTDPLGRTTTYSYDSRNRRTTATTPVTAGVTRTATVTYDAEGQAVASADFLGRVTTTTFDSRGWAATVTDPLGNVATYTYSATGKVTQVTDPSSGGAPLAAYAYDAADRLTTVTDGLSHTKVTVHDGVGNVTAKVDGNGNRTTFAYDARNRLTTITDALSHSTVLAYDSGGNRTSVTDALAHATATAYDALDRPTTITDARGAVTTMAYDAAGRTVGLTDPVGNRTTWAYDAADRMTTETAPVPSGVNGVSTYAYDNADQLIDRTDRNGRRTTYAYDLAGRRVNERWLNAGGGVARRLTFTYDAADQLVGARDPDATLTFAYDSGGRPTAAGTSGGGTGQPAVTLTYGYNEAGNRTSMADNVSGNVGLTTYQYDAAHRLVTLTRSHNGTAGPRIIYGYDDGDRPTSLDRTINGGGKAVATTLSYDAADRLTTQTHQVGGGSVLATFLYAYDNADRLTTQTDAEGAAGFSYDNADQLTGVSGSRSESYGYDSGGNRTMTGYTTADGNQLAASPGFTYAYDAEGNQTGKTETATGKVTTFSYDYRNRLTGATQKDSKSAVLMRATYTYDVLGRRLAADVDADGAGGGAAVKTWMVYDGGDTYADFAGAGTLATRYLHGPAVDALLARTSSGGTTAWYLADGLGSVRDIASTAGAVIDHLAYDSYGGVASESAPSSGDRHKFAGGELDAGTGLYAAGGTPYDPAAGRLLGRGPAGPGAGATNPYGFAGNAPTGPVAYHQGMAAEKARQEAFNEEIFALEMANSRRDSSPYDLIDKIDEFAAGFGDALTAGLSTKLREALYGEIASQNHSGELFEMGQVAGEATNLVIGFGNPCSMGQLGSAGLRALNVMQSAGHAAQSAECLMNGDYGGAVSSAIEAGSSMRQATRPCFAAGTPLLTPDGDRPIEEFRPGDWVLSAPEDDPEAAPEPRQVEAVFQSYAPLMELRVEGRTIRTTAEHPFWVRGRGWTAAQQLMVGDHLKSFDNRWSVLAYASSRDEAGIVYNLCVADYHTYFVGRIHWGLAIWSHNARNCTSGNNTHAQAGNNGHYDVNNGGAGYGFPSQLNARYPATDFDHRPRGVRGPDVTYRGGPHPSTYPGSKWPAGNNHADFKPNSDRGKSRFRYEVRSGKLPTDTTMITYDSHGNII